MANKKQIADCKIFKINIKELEVKNKIGSFVEIESPDWVCVIPKIKNNFLLIRQFRIGIEKKFIEFPGGIINKNETPIEAGLRELKEETGYEGKATYLGYVYANPAFMTNKMHYILVENIEKKSNTEFDEFEDIETIFLNENQISELIGNGIINHSMMVSAWCKFSHYKK